MLTAVRQAVRQTNKQNHFGNIVWFVPICQKDRHQIRYSSWKLDLGFVADWVSRGDDKDYLLLNF